MVISFFLAFFIIDRGGRVDSRELGLYNNRAVVA